MEKKSAEEDKAAPAAPAASVDLKAVFSQYSKGKPDIDGRTFFKIFKDNKVTDKVLTETNIDLAFAKCSVAKKMNFANFQKGIAELAAKKHCSPAELSNKLGSAGKPVYAGTKAEKVALHDDKSKYTGVYAKGGPSTVDKDKITSISQTCDRTAADVRGSKK